MTVPDRIWATEDKENFGEDRFHSTFPMKGLTEYVRADLYAAQAAEIAWLLGAMTTLRDDMLVRAECGIDRIRGEQYRVVNAGNGAWVGFIDALAAYDVTP